MSIINEFKNIVLTPEEIVKRNKQKVFVSAGYGERREVLANTQNVENHIMLDDKGKPMVKRLSIGEGKYKGSLAEADTWDKIEYLRKKVKNELKNNTMGFPPDYYELYQAVMMDITRRAADEVDITGILSAESTRPNAANPYPIREMLPFSGKFKKYVSGGQVPLIQQKTGAKSSIDLTIMDIGFDRDLYSVLFDLDIFSMQKVLDAVAQAHRGERNGVVMDPLLSATWHTSQIQAADTDGDTYDERVYNTMLKAYKLIKGLLDMQTGKAIPSPQLLLIMGDEVTSWAVNRVIYGQLRGGENSKVINLSPIDINSILVYKGDSWVWGEELVTFDGVAANTAYLVVPGTAGAPYFTINKAPLTQEVGRGSVLTLTQEQKAWWYCQGSYFDEWMGSSGALSGTKYVSGYGYVVKIELPSSTPTT